MESASIDELAEKINSAGQGTPLFVQRTDVIEGIDQNTFYIFRRNNLACMHDANRIVVPMYGTDLAEGRGDGFNGRPRSFFGWTVYDCSRGHCPASDRGLQVRSLYIPCHALITVGEVDTLAALGSLNMLSDLPLEVKALIFEEDPPALEQHYTIH